MSSQDQLEIINALGEIRFHGLNSARGITNIGRHPDNDIVLDSPAVAPFHAILDHQRKPYRIVALTGEAAVKVSGETLRPNVPKEIRNWDTIELDGCSIVLMEAGAVAGEPAPVIAPAPLPVPLPVAAPAPAAAPAGPSAASAAPSEAIPDLDELDRLLAMMPEDHQDEYILVEPLAQNGAMDAAHPTALDFNVDVEQPATMQVSITNGGPLVGEFVVEVRGLPPAWVIVSPAAINLNDGQRGNVSIAITAPRLPSSRAKAHYFSVVVTSPNYPGRQTSVGGLFLIKPFYDYAVGDIDPKKQKIAYSKKVGRALFPIANLGNGPMTFQIQGEDERHASNIEFDSPEEGLKLANQIEVTVQPEETLAVPVFITPRRHRAIGIGGENIQYTLTVTPLSGGQQTPRSVLAQASSLPLIGPIPIILLALLLAVLVVIVFTPRIEAFEADRTLITAGERAVLSWRASAFTSLKLEPGDGQPVDGPTGSETVAPEEQTAYTLTAETWLALLLPQWFRVTSDPIVINVVPVIPEIEFFDASSREILLGETVTVSWDVADATGLNLSINDSNESIPNDQFTNSRTFSLTRDTVFTLRAVNQYTGAEGITKSLTVKVTVPEPTPLPAPNIQQFDVLPLNIVAGEPVTITWAVLNSETITIDGVEGQFPPNGSLTVRPLADTSYILTASNGQVEVKSGVKQVIVSPAPTPTPLPGAPKIEFFIATPFDVAVGSPESKAIVLSWKIEGDTTQVEITGPDGARFTGLPKEGTLPITTDKASLYVLTAFNGPNLRSSQTAQIKVRNPVPRITSLNPSSSSNVGGGGFTLTVNGSGFVPESKVQWAGSNRTTVYISESQLTAAILAEDMVTAGTFDVKVFNASPGGGTSGTASFTLNNPVPTVTSLSPGSITKESPGITLTVYGSNFVSGSVVRFGGVDAPTTYIGPTELSAQVTTAQLANAGAPGVAVFNPGPGGGTSNSVTFTINASNPKPTINALTDSPPGLSPFSATVGAPMQTLTIRGTNFIPQSVVRWKTTTYTPIYIDDTTLRVDIPADRFTAVGTARVTVYNPPPGGDYSNSVTFTILSPAFALLPATNPMVLPVGAAPTQITVSLGQAQPSATTITLANSNSGLMSITQYSDSACTATAASTVTVPAGATTATFCVQGIAPGTSPVTLTASLPTALGGGQAIKQFNTTAAAPTLTALAVPTDPVNLTGSPSPGIGVGMSSTFTLTLTGTNFRSGAKVRWTGKADLTPFSVTPTQIQVTVPTTYVNTIGTPSISVLNADGSTSGGLTFNINAPTISSISPTTKAAGEAGFTLTVNGSNFVPGSKVLWFSASPPSFSTCPTPSAAIIASAQRTTTFQNSTTVTADIPYTDLDVTIPLLLADVNRCVAVINPGNVLSPSPFSTVAITKPTISLTTGETPITSMTVGTTVVMSVDISPTQVVSRTVNITKLSGFASVAFLTYDSATSSCTTTAITSIVVSGATARFCVSATDRNVSTSSTSAASIDVVMDAFSTQDDQWTLAVTPATATVTVAETAPLQANHPVTGESVTFRATITDSVSVIPEGTVTFERGGVDITGCIDLPISGNPPTAECATTLTAAASPVTIEADYTDTSQNFNDASGSLSETVYRADTTATLNSSPASTSVYGATITLQARVNITSPGGGTLGGNVEFLNSPSTVLSTQAISGPSGTTVSASFSGASSLNAGSYNFIARYAGNSNYNASPSTSPAIAYTVTPANTTITATSSDTGVYFGESVTFTATVTNSSATGRPPTGTVHFRAGVATIGTCSAQPLSGSGNTSTATCTYSGLNAGTYSITATYDNTDGNFDDVGKVSTAFSQIVQAAPVTVSNATNDSVSVYGQSVTFTATVTNTQTTATPTGTIRFHNGAADLCASVSLSGSGSTATAQCVYSSLAVGTHTISATWTNSDGNFNASDPTGNVTQTVVPDLQLSAPSATTIQVGGGADSASEAQFTVTLVGGTFASAQTINLTASSSSDLRFTDCSGTTQITSIATTAPAYTTATFCAVGIDDGSSTVTATHNITNGDSATSVTITINNPTITLSTCPSSTTGALVTLTITISAAQSGNTNISLNSSNTSVGMVPGSDVISAGTTTESFGVSKSGNGTTNITASLPASLGGGGATPNPCDVTFNP